jgi:hypothetical protein
MKDDDKKGKINKKLFGGTRETRTWRKNTKGKEEQMTNDLFNCKAFQQHNAANWETNPDSSFPVRFLLS